MLFRRLGKRDAGGQDRFECSPPSCTPSAPTFRSRPPAFVKESPLVHEPRVIFPDESIELHFSGVRMEDPRLQHSDTEVHQCGHLAKVNPYQLLNGCRAIWIRTLRN